MTKTADWVRQPDGSYKKGKKTIIKNSTTSTRRWKLGDEYFLTLADAKDFAETGKRPKVNRYASRYRPTYPLDSYAQLDSVVLTLDYTCADGITVTSVIPDYVDLTTESDGYGCSCCSSVHATMTAQISKCSNCGHRHTFDLQYQF